MPSNASALGHAVKRKPAGSARRLVIAAVADDAVAPQVLATANTVARLFCSRVQALHAGKGEPTLTAAARKARVPLKSLAGPASEVLAREAAADEVAAVVIGARSTAADRRPAGSTVLALITSLKKPVVVVPPDAAVTDRLQYLLLPLDGTTASTDAVRKIMELAADADLRIGLVHVHEENMVPAFSDQPAHEVSAWSQEFIARHCPGHLDATLEVRVGEPDEQVLDVCRWGGFDLVALAWGQKLTRGHAAVVKRMLDQSAVPVLLVPRAPAQVECDGRGAVRSELKRAGGSV